MAGRPIIWEGEKKEEAIKLVMQGVVEGKSLRAIFKEQKDNKKLPSRKTFNEWLAGDLELSDLYASCACVREDDIFEECLEIADDQEDDTYEDEDGNVHVNHNVINRSKVRIDTRKWMLGKMRPKKYGDRVVNENINKNTDIPSTLEEAKQVLEDFKKLGIDVDADEKKE